MVIHTAQQAAKATLLERIIIAIDDIETYAILEDFNFELVMTSKQHLSGTDRIAEAVNKLSDAEIIINIQADEPFVDPKAIDSLVESFNQPSVHISTLVNKHITKEILKDKNVVKAILDDNHWAVDFKRILETNAPNEPIYKHMGIYGYTQDALMKFVSIPQSEREKQRNLEQMRALDNNIQIKAVITELDSFSIDTEEDYYAAKRAFT